MARRRRKNRTDRPPFPAAGSEGRGDLSEWTGDGRIRNTPFAELKARLKQAASENIDDGRKQASHISGSGGPGSSACAGKVKKYGTGPGGQTSQVEKSCSSCHEKGGDTEGSGRACRSAAAGPEDDSLLFLQAMDGVKPLDSGVRVVAPSADMRRHRAAAMQGMSQESEDALCTSELDAIVQGRKEIPVEHTPEYVEGPEINSNPRIVRRLRRGRFSIQGYCDLHGLTAREAMEWCEEFMSRSITANRSCIAFIHGRGLSSPKGPVLKKMVHEWLQTGRWRRHVIAYSSAPGWDGGPGVTYVLLRQKPAPRKKRRKPRLWHS